jgi:CBS domain-containing protein
VDRGRPLDVLGEGDMFGHPSMLSGLPTGFEARAHEDLLCYRLPADVVVPLLARPAGLRFVARTLLGRPKPEGSAWLADVDPAQRPVRTLLRERAVVCDPETTIRRAASEMAADGASSALVRLHDGEFGIVTDRDLRVKVVAEGMPSDASVSEVMSAPAYSVRPEAPGTEVMLEMLDRGVQHVPVVTASGEPLGVLTDVDLLAVETRTPFWLRRSIDLASNVEQLKAAVGQLNPTVIALEESDVPPAQISAIIAIVIDAMTRRLIELTIDRLGEPPCPFTWLALGGLGRREVTPSSDVDSALAWDGDDGDPEQRRYMSSLARRVTQALAEVGFVSDRHGATAAEPLFERSVAAWRDEIRYCNENPGKQKALILISLLYDGRPVHSVGPPADVLEEFRKARGRRDLLRLLLRLALAHRPPTGFMRFRGSPRDLVVEHSGAHRGHLDIKEGGMLPIAAIARYAGLAAGAVTESTRDRLRAAATAEKLTAEEARTLEEAYDLFWGLRIEHQVEQLRRGVEPDNYLDPKALNPLTRRYLRDAFHAVRSVQRKLSAELTYG